MSRQHTMRRLIIPAALALAALFITACENPTNATPTDPNTLVLPAGTLQGWVPGAAGADWYIKYYGDGESSSTSSISFTGLGVLSISSDQYPGQTLTRSEIASRLTDNATVNFRRPWPLDNTTANSLVVLSPNDETMALRVSRLSRSGDHSIFYDLVRRSADRNTRIEWWYVEADSTANGVYDLTNTFYRFVDTVQLSAGWNTIVLTRRTPSTNGSDPSNQWDVTAGPEPAGMSWYLYSSGNTPRWYE